MKKKTIKNLIIFVIVLITGLVIAYLAGQNGSKVGPLSVFMICALWAFAVNWIGFIPANMAKSEKYYDLTGAFTNSTTILLAAFLSQPLSARAIIVTILVTVWAVRLGGFLFKRVCRDGHDQRFNKIKINPMRFLNAWNLQALWVILTTACALAIVTSGDDKPLGALGYLGIAVWVIGFGIEVIADGQKKAFRSNPDNKNKFISSGLWSWSRHPNYFGEIVLWIGIAIIALPVLSGGQWVALISPVFVVLLLTRVSGVPLLEASADKKLGGSKDYELYKKQTSVLMLSPPKAP